MNHLTHSYVATVLFHGSAHKGWLPEESSFQFVFLSASHAKVVGTVYKDRVNVFEHCKTENTLLTLAV